MTPNSPEAEIWSWVQTMNRLWTEQNNCDALRDYFHPDMVAITPTDSERLVGVEACVAGWAKFVRMAKSLQWRVESPDVRLFADGTCAVVTYFYEAKCEIGGRALQLRGRDMLTLAKERGRWWLVADQFSPFPGA